jgi:hypothetical protein
VVVALVVAVEWQVLGQVGRKVEWTRSTVDDLRLTVPLVTSVSLTLSLYCKDVFVDNKIPLGGEAAKGGLGHVLSTMRQGRRNINRIYCKKKW